MITTITLELVRHGTLHNQLLSPLTPYIALAGNLSAETVYVPVEHAQMLARLRRLVYSPNRDIVEGLPEDHGDRRRNNELRMFRALSDLREASQVVTRLFESIHGLSEAITDAVSRRLSERSEETSVVNRASTDGIIRLRLIVSANELAMLPFELAQGPLSLGGSDMLSALRPPPVVITRESRRSALHQFTFKSPEEYRVLLVAADPEGRGLPLRACLLAVYQAFPTLLVDPFLGYPHELESVRSVVDSQKERVTVLSAATLESVAAELSTGKLDADGRRWDYTHVLILAHGNMPESIDAQPTVVLHSARNSAAGDAVTGERLAAALCAARRDDAARHIKPLFVSLMVCDSAKQNQVPLFAGGSIAHTLHEGGVPFVVASQFPLTFSGAVLLTEVLLSRLLRNHHPTAAIAEARQRLFTELGETHDWASLVSYVTLPEDQELNEEVAHRRFELLSQTLHKLLDLLPTHECQELEKLEQQAFDVLVMNFRRALEELRSTFDPEHAKAQRLSQAASAKDRFSEDGQNKDCARYAAILANAYLWDARLENKSGSFFVATVSGEPAAATIQMTESVRERLALALSYCDAHVFFGGRNIETYAQKTLLLELLNRGAPCNQVQRWWYVADWRVMQAAVESQSAPMISLGTELIHLLISAQIGIDPAVIELRGRLTGTCDRIVQRFHSAAADIPRDGDSLKRRLNQCRHLWWGPSSPAIAHLENVEQVLSRAGVWLASEQGAPPATGPDPRHSRERE